MSGQSASSSGKSTPQATPQQFAAMYQNYLPSIMATATNQNAPVANSLAGAAANANPLYTASGLNQLNQYAPGYAEAGNRLSQQQALNSADLLAGGGGLTALMGAGLNNLLNPAQAAANRGAVDLVNSINMNGLSGGEQAAVERSLNQSNYARGNLGIDNATNAVSNAMQFGNALSTKRAEMGNALGAATNVANAQNTQFNPITVAMNAGNTSGNFGLSTFNPTQANANLTTPYNFGSSFGTQLAGVSAASNSKNSSSSSGGGLCCFIFLEATNGKMPWWVRSCRDEYYHKFPAVSRGYIRMSKVLVPLMRRYPLVKSLVNKLMVIPITNYGGFLKQVDGYEKYQYRSFAKHFWFGVWRVLGSF